MRTKLNTNLNELSGKFTLYQYVSMFTYDPWAGESYILRRWCLTCLAPLASHRRDTSNPSRGAPLNSNRSRAGLASRAGLRAHNNTLLTSNCRRNYLSLLGTVILSHCLSALATNLQWKRSAEIVPRTPWR